MSVHARVPAFALRVCAVAVLLLIAAARSVFAQADASGGSAPPSPPSQPPPIATTRPVGLFAEPKLFVTAIDFATERYDGATGVRSNGFYPELSNMITGSGWISLGPGYRHFYSDDRVMLDGSAAVSWHLYQMVQGRIEFPKLAGDHLIAGVQGMWQDQTQISYFGIGSDTTEDDRSQYRMQTHDVVGYAKLIPTDSLAITGEFGWLGSPRIMAPSGTFRMDALDVRDAFPSDPAVSLTEQPVLLHSEAAVMADTRDHRGHPTRGFMYRAAVTNYSDQSTGTFSFRQYEAEASHFIPIADTAWGLAFRGWSVYSDVPLGHQIPFYLQPALGGNNTLRDYSTDQLHGDHLLLANVEARVGLMAHLEAAVFVDAGNVASRYSDLNFDKTSYGGGLRVHTDTTTLARLDVAQGSQGWRVVVRTSEPLRLSRGRRYVAAIPFMP